MSVRTRPNTTFALFALAVLAGVGMFALWLALGPWGDAKAGPNATAVHEMHFDEDDDGVPDRVVDLTTVSEQQAAALADGYVTWEEYESSIWAAYSCLQEAGFEPREEPHLNAAGTKLIFSVWSGNGPAGAALGCHEHHSMLVEMSLLRQQAPSVETRIAAEGAVRHCLIAGGYDVAEVAAAGSFTAFEGRDDGGLYFRCLRQVSIDYKAGWWAGN